MKTSLMKLLLLIIATLSISACAFGRPYYTSLPINARVVDAETNEPIEGAIVTANWHLVKGGLDGPRHVGQLEVMETVTDKYGKFSFPGFTKANLTGGELRDEDPQILIFKAEYKYAAIRNDYSVNNLDPGPLRKAYVDGQTVKLRKFNGNYITNSPYSGLDTTLYRVIEDCEWKKTPFMFIALDAEYNRLKIMYPERSIYLPSISFLEGYAAKCGSAKEFFKAYKSYGMATI